jgi:uncharacterized protein
MADRLRQATSPYLLQHADNPVDWWPWSDEAFAEARRRGVPVMLSVGYSACHWCHVMAHESFEDGPTAALMNENLVAIKVDREERPDVDAVYMTATQAMTGQGGWPMTVFMTPEREPFYCGTYFPREQFQRLIMGVVNAWRKDPGDVASQARQIAAALAERAGSVPGGMLAEGQPDGAAPGAEQLDRACADAIAGLAASYDARRGGFGGAPQFPPSMVIEFLLRHHERTEGTSAHPAGEAAVTAGAVVAAGSAVTGDAAASGDAPAAGDGDAAGGPAPAGGPALSMAVGTAEAMARGGLYDQLGGGFARYSVDANWVVPHFEKMLYDNALLARAYAHLWRRTGSALAGRVAAETCAWMIRELGTAQGGFAAALDADSEGEEGKFYVWTPDQLRAVLGPADGEYAAQAFGVTDAGTFERGSSVLQLRADPADPERMARIKDLLLTARAERVRPARDDKVVAAWNGLAIAALAEAGLLLSRPEFTAAARSAAGLLAGTHLTAGRLARTSRDGIAGPSAGVLEDYACVADGFIALAGVTGEARWLDLAGELLATSLDRFGDPSGGFYDTADDGEALIYRPADAADGPSPSGTFALAGALLSYAALTGSARHREAAAGALVALPAIAARYPRAAGSGLAVAEALLSGPVEIAIVGPPGDERTAELHRTALLAAPPGAVIAVGAPGNESGGIGGQAGSGDGHGARMAGGAGGQADSGDGDDGRTAGGAGAAGAPVGGQPIPLLAGRGLVDGRPAAYVCRDFACRLPVTEPSELRSVLAPS